MIDFIVNTFGEIADFFINFGVDKVIDKFTKKEINKSGVISERKGYSKKYQCPCSLPLRWLPPAILCCENVYNKANI